MSDLSKVDVEYDNEEGSVQLEVDFEKNLVLLPLLQDASDYFENLANLSLGILEDLQKNMEVVGKGIEAEPEAELEEEPEIDVEEESGEEVSEEVGEELQKESEEELEEESEVEEESGLE